MVVALTLPTMLMVNPAPAGNVFDARDLSGIYLYAVQGNEHTDGNAKWGRSRGRGPYPTGGPAEVSARVSTP